MVDHWSRSRKLLLFAALYFVQGAALAYFRNFQKPYLDELGIDPDVVGLLAGLLLLPFVLKIFIGMLSDRVNLLGFGHRRPYIVLGLLLTALAFVAAGFVQPDVSLGAFAMAVLLAAFGATLFDSTTDGLAIDITPAEDHGAVQGSMVSGRAAGFIILSLVFGVLVESQGHRVIFFIIAIIMLLPLLGVLGLKEPERRSAEREFDWSAFAVLRQRRFLFFAGYAVFYSIAAYGIDGLVTLFMSDGFNAADSAIGTYGAARGVGAILGAIGGGFLLGRIGRRPGAYAALLLVSAAGVVIALADGATFLVWFGLFWGLAWGFQETIFVALAMGLSDGRVAASMFAIMMALSNIGIGIGEAGATSLTDNISYSAIFYLLAAINFVNFPILYALFRSAPDLAADRPKAVFVESGGYIDN